jgi:hypothetical protein
MICIYFLPLDRDLDLDFLDRDLDLDFFRRPSTGDADLDLPLFGGRPRGADCDAPILITTTKNFENIFIHLIIFDKLLLSFYRYYH